MKTERRILRNFIVLEGLDGSGTTTQGALLARRLRSAGARVMSTCEPTAGPVGLFIRGILKREVNVEPCTLAHLFVADRNEHLFDPKDGILSRLGTGEIVVCDRYLFSSLAYQSVGCAYELVAELNDRFPLPEYLVFLDVPPEECQRRLRQRKGVELFDEMDIQARILRNYERAIAEFAAERVHVLNVDGQAGVEEIAGKIWSLLSGLPIQKV